MTTDATGTAAASPTVAAGRRRHELAEATLQYVLQHGLLGLSLRPLAASLGTSDRMLIYHFGSKAQLIADVLELANHRLAAGVTSAIGGSAPRTVGQIVERAWRLMTSAGTDAVTKMYVELCALSVRDPATWAPAHGRLREPWLRLLED